MQMLRAASSAAYPAGAAHQLGKQGAQIAAIGQEVPVAAMVAEYHVTWLQVAQHAHGIGLLSQVGMRGPKEEAFGKIFQHRFFKAANAVQGVVQVSVRWLAHKSMIYKSYHVMRGK